MSKSKTTREKLIDATFQEVYSCGYHGASLANILNQAEVKKGAMYHYFPSKKDLVIAMIEEKFEQRQIKMWGKLLKTKGNIIDELIEILNNTKKWDLKRGCPLGNLLQESFTSEKELADTLSTVLDNWKAKFVKILKRAQEEKQIKTDINLEESTIFIIASIEGALLLAKKQNKAGVFEACMNQLTIYLDTLRIN